MSSIVKNLIEYTGIANPLPELCTPGNFKQFSLQKTLTIPEDKPDVEQIVRVADRIVITNTRVVRTPRTTSAEGQVLTGFKLSVEGELRGKIEYLAEEPSHALHAGNFNTPFSSFIILPGDFVIGTAVTVTGYIEDVYAKLVDERTIFEYLSILIVAD
jgi:hypothetical protein